MTKADLVNCIYKNLDITKKESAIIIDELFEIIKKTLESGEKVKISKVDSSKNRRLCLNLKVLGLPTFLVYKEGKEVDRLSGNDLNFEEIEAAIRKVIG